MEVEAESIWRPAPVWPCGQTQRALTNLLLCPRGGLFTGHVSVEPDSRATASFCVVDDLLVHILRNLCGEGHRHGNDLLSMQTGQIAENLIRAIETHVLVLKTQLLGEDMKHTSGCPRSDLGSI